MILVGDCLETLPTLAAKRFQCCVTSPPYFALRDYGVEGQHGLEKIPDCLAWARGEPPCNDCFVCCQRKVFAEVHRVLRDDGTLWLNLGDSTASSGGNGAGGNAGRVGRAFQQRNVRPIKPPHLRPKNLLGIPWRVALALQADGWILRQDIIWHKKTPMPETAKDRPTRAHEYLFLFSKRRRYYYDRDAIAEPCSPNSHARAARGDFGPPVGGKTRLAQKEAEFSRNPGRGQQYGRDAQAARKAYAVPSGWDTRKGSHRDLTGRYGGDERRPREKNNPSFDQAMGAAGYMPTMRNKRSVWTLGPEPFKGAHFATFPRSLARLCILAGTRPGDEVLDCYFGSGTTGVVALELGRGFAGCELSAQYAREIAEPRLRATQPGLPLQVDP